MYLGIVVRVPYKRPFLTRWSFVVMDKKINKCKCGKAIDRRSKHCHPCASLGKKYPDRKLSEIHKANIALARKREWDSGERKGGWKLTPEQIEKVRKAHLGRKTPVEVRIKQSKAKLGKYKREKHWNWKGEKASYGSFHHWLYRELKQPGICEFCKKTGLKGHQIHWANKSGEYKRDLADWLRLCAKCHYHYDRG